MSEIVEPTDKDMVETLFQQNGELMADCGRFLERIEKLEMALRNARSFLPTRPDDPVNVAMRQEIVDALRAARRKR